MGDKYLLHNINKKNKYFLHNINIERNIVGLYEIFIYLGMQCDDHSWFLISYIKKYKNKQINFLHLTWSLQKLSMSLVFDPEIILNSNVFWEREDNAFLIFIYYSLYSHFSVYI
jgi:hypothetical protein